ncbi:MAG: cupredoxin domain-containing protein [Candidatus Sericytochromatia bacterium]|nr:cupredoxin domain-containing protein [Candidatus Tanganyikabacteria bacterium]
MTRHLAPVRSLALASLLLLPGCPGGGATVSSPTAAPGGEVIVTMTNFAFSPESVTVSLGQSVRFINRDFMAHTVTPLDASAFPMEDNVRPGEERVVTPRSAGNWSFRCDYHPGMKGGLVVTGAAKPTGTPEPAPSTGTPVPATPSPTPLPAPSSSPSAPVATPTPEAVVEVAITGFAFVPSTIVARPGQTLRFTNREAGVPHTVTSVVTGTVAKVLDSPRLEAGQTYTLAINAMGSYPIFCKFHPGMKATVRIE